MKKFKIDKLSMFVSGIIIITVIITGIFFNRLDKINKELDTVYETQKNRHMEIIDYAANEKNSKDKEFRDHIEYMARSQMRLDLQSIGYLVQAKIEKKLKNNDLNKTEEFVEKIKDISFETISSFRNYNSEGDYFVIVTIGGYSYFLIDNSENYGEPKFSGKKILNIKNRTRSIFDEVIWQEETKLILSKYGLISEPNYIKSYDAKELNIKNKYKIDAKLSNTEVFKFKEIKYIEEKYPEVYNKLNDLKIIMHKKPELAEKFMNFITYNRSTTPEDNYYWNLDDESKREALEVYVVPTGMYGFFDAKKTKAAGVFNEKYVKISIVSGIKIDDYISEFDKEFDNYNEIINKFLNTNYNSLKKIEYEKNKIIKSNQINKIFITIITLLSFISISFSFFHVPKDFLNKEFIDEFICDRCNKTEDTESGKKGG